jgi:hypothetical protein
MTEEEVFVVMRQHLEGKFPKKCALCHRTYANLKDYLLRTTHVGPPRSYDLEMGVHQPTKPIGTMSLANCACGNTLAIDSSGMELTTMWRLMAWLLAEMNRRGQKPSMVLESLRAAIDQDTLADKPIQ